MTFEEVKQGVRDTLWKLNKYIPVQELTHAADLINTKGIEEDGTVDEDVMYEAHSYLQAPDKEFIPGQTVDTKALTNNLVRIAFADIRKLFKEYAESVAP